MFKNSLSLNSWFQLSYIYLLIQQIIVASSSIWLTKLILGISDGQPILTWLWLYLISLILPYLPGALALLEVTKNQVKYCVNYVQKFSEIYPGKVLQWSDQEQRSTISSILSGEACPTITGYSQYLYHLISSGINVSFNLIVLSALINSSLLITYFLGIFLSATILYFQKKFKEKLALKAQESRIQWTSLLIKSWDNILLNNIYNLNIWSKKASSQSKNLIKNTIELEKFNQFIGIMMAFALIIPSVIFIAYLAIKNLGDLAFLATLTVLFPRLFQILTYSYELLFYISNFPVQQAKLKTVLSLIQPCIAEENSNELMDRIQWDKISIKPKLDQLTIKELLKTPPQTGRITLQGENGSGKTSLLLMIKAKHKNEAFYLPSKHDLLFELEKSQLSTGQLAYQILKEIKNSIQTPIILLDEWDSNLDQRNRQELTSLIDELSLKHCVIEVLHTKN